MPTLEAFSWSAVRREKLSPSAPAGYNLAYWRSYRYKRVRKTVFQPGVDPGETDCACEIVRS